VYDRTSQQALFDRKVTAKERDTETNTDDFGARYYSSSFGRWTSPDWSAIPAPVPYANLTNPQTLNLYAMVSDNPETFADLDGHNGAGNPSAVDFSAMSSCGAASDQTCTGDGWVTHNTDLSAKYAGVDNAATQYDQKERERIQKEQEESEFVVSPTKEAEFRYGSQARTQIVDYMLFTLNSNGELTTAVNPTDHTTQLKEKVLSGKVARACTSDAICPATKGAYFDNMSVTTGKGHSVEKRFTIDGKAARVYDPETKKAYDFVRVDASVRKGFVFNYGNDPN